MYLTRFNNDDFSRFLLEQKILDEQRVRASLREAIKSSKRLDQVIAKLGYIPEDKIVSLLADHLKIPYQHLSDKVIDREIIGKVPAKFAHHYQFLPVEISGSKLVIATNDPQNLELLDEIKLALECDVKPVLSGERDIQEALKKYYGIGAATVEKLLNESGPTIAIETPTIQTEEISGVEGTEDASIVKFVNQILYEGYKDRATDIHIEPFEDDLRIRYRIDGVLYRASMPPTIRHFHSSIVSRIKIMANLDIAERRLPQDGRIKVKIGEEDLDLRVSILPTPYGESVNIRLLSSHTVLLELESLGLLPPDLETLEKMIRKPHGIIFVTGPTGSGKTTTLYACLSKLNNEEKKIITIEDPIEYLIKGVTQIQIHPKIDLTFARGLRSMLRHDPNIMMVGEVRDFETAEITIRVALTGHLVFSTLHTNDAAGAVTRLVDMGVEPYLVASSVECIIAQRLVRLICPHCKNKVKLTPEDLSILGLSPKELSTPAYDGNGCEKCKFTGYQGRTAIYEFLVLDDELRNLIVKKRAAHEVKALALARGMRTLGQDGWEKVKKGLTSVSEVIRVSQDENQI
ncbi:MAG: type II/IV secretion system protein [Chlamydiae bacterium]|nr:type II/IV secretion system protein [Chlamydiota bacterium]MBI3267193.1 type II/IV secretion system protein [Chlamydiota bacterium]